MGGLSNVIAAIHAMGVELRNVAENAAVASKEVAKYRQERDATAGMTKGSKGGGVGADSGSDGGAHVGMTAAQAVAALKSVRGRTL